MIPIVEMAARTEAQPDRRKTRTLLWKEAELALVRRNNEIEPLVSVTMGDPATAGNSLKQLAQAAGLTADSRVHGLGSTLDRRTNRGSIRCAGRLPGGFLSPVRLLGRCRASL